MPLIVVGLLIAALIGGSVVSNVVVKTENPSSPYVKIERTVTPTSTLTPTPTIVA